MEEILQQVRDGQLTVAEAKSQLATYENLGFAKVDHHRKKRQGFPEIIYGEGKTTEQILAIMKAILAKKEDVLITRISKEKAEVILQKYPKLMYHELARILSYQHMNQVNRDLVIYL